MVAQKWGRVIGVTTSIDSMYREGMCPYGPSKAGHEALVALMARELERTGVTANVLIPGGATDTNIFSQDFGYDRAALMRPEVMQAPAVWLASEESKGTNGKRFIAYDWDEKLAHRAAAGEGRRTRRLAPGGQAVDHPMAVMTYVATGTRLVIGADDLDKARSAI